MDYTRAREEIKERWEDILRQITSPAKDKVNGQTSYICPLCGHGTHGDGLTYNPKSKDKGLKCFGCDFSGDIIDLIGEVENITDYPRKIARAGEYIGITVEGGSTAQEDFSPASSVGQNQPRTEQYTHMDIHTDTYTQKPTENYLQYYRECQTHLPEKDYHTRRGISEEVATRFMLGYDMAFSTKDADTGQYIQWEALIIPTGYDSFTARNTDPNATDKNRYRNRGGGNPINWKALQKAQKPIYIVEGEIDCLSILTVGGEAIGLGSLSNADRFIANYVKKYPPKQPLVLALDNEEDPQKQKKVENATEKLAKGLTELGVEYYIYNPAGEHKDANEALIADREAFTKAVAHAESLEAEALEAELEEYEATTAYNHLQDFVNGIAESVNTPAQPTGFKVLDCVLDGGIYPGLYIVGGLTSIGKTTFALQICDQVAQSGRDVIIVSLEMARAELMSKSISRHTLMDVLDTEDGDIANAKTNRGITVGARYPRYSEEEKAIISRAITAYSQYAKHIHIIEGLGDLGTAQIREIVRKGALKARKEGKQPPILLVDYLQIIAPHDVRASDKQNTDKNVLELKRISRDFNTAVIGVSSLNRASYNEKIDLSAYKESGSIEYGSDVLIGLQLKGAGKKDFDSTEAKQKDPREIELVILKNRNGKTGNTVNFEYYPLFNYFKEA